MNQITTLRLSRRNLLAGAALLVAFPAVGHAASALPPGIRLAPKGARPPLRPDQLDSFIALRPDGTILALFGKMDPGQGVDVAIGQIVAEELDVPASAVQVIQGDTAWTVNQGGASGSTGIEIAGVTLRFAAAEARRVLVEHAATHLGVPVAALATQDGAVVVAANPAQRVVYAQLLADGYFDTGLQWNGVTGFSLFSRGVAQPKDPATYRVVGQSVPRQDIRRNMFAQQVYVTDIRLPDMLHARMIRPPAAGALPLQIDKSGLAAIPGAQLVQEKSLVAVLAPKEWDAIRAARALKITWSDPPAAFPEQTTLYDHIRAAPALAHKDEFVRGDVAATLAAAPKVITAEYEWPYQSHASMGGACAVVDVGPDGTTIFSGTQKPHYARDGVAKLLGIDVAQVRCIWTRGPGSYGRNDAGDAVMDAAYLSRATGRPVRVQYMRDQGTGWDPKGPASVHQCQAALDAQGAVTGYRFLSRGFSRIDIDTNESDPRDSLAGQMLGLGQHSTQGFGAPGERYDFPHQVLAWETVPPLLANASPLRTAHLRDPVGPQINFASESFIDELAYAANADPVAFRLAHLSAPRAMAVVRAAAEKFGWQARPAASLPRHDGDLVTGRGVALAQRSNTLVAAIVEISVNRRTGDVLPLRWAVAHDCGLIVNPRGLHLTIEGNIVHGTSRALLEEVTFSRHAVTSTDWLSYPILDISQVPQRIDIVTLNHPELPATGAGEASSRPVAAAIGNAIFDATGIRLRRAPFTPDRVKAALA